MVTLMKKERQTSEVDENGLLWNHTRGHQDDKVPWRLGRLYMEK